MPRHYAAEIMKIKSKEERQKYLVHNVPGKFQGLVRTLVINEWNLRKFRGKPGD